MRLDKRLRLVKQVVQELNDDLIYALSLGSKELFHTNLLGWFAEHEPIISAALLREWDPRTPPALVRARRELHHLDLVLHEVKADGAAGPARVVVENKMFALPNLEQLRRYGLVINTHFRDKPSLVLLSLADPGWPQGTWDDGAGNIWRHCSYQSLTQILTSDTRPLHVDRFAVATLQAWTTMMSRLAQLSDLVSQPRLDEVLLLPEAVRNELNQIRLDAPVQKLRAYHVTAQLRKELGDLLTDEVSIGVNFTNGHGLIEAFVGVGDNVEAGWQLQGSQWRMAIRVTKKHPLYGHGALLDAQRAQLADKTGWIAFEGTPFEGALSFPRIKGGTPKFGKFAPDFVYRYVHVPNLTLTTAVDTGLHIIHCALSERDSPRWRYPR